jgi:hypothetical protein
MRRLPWIGERGRAPGARADYGVTDRGFSRAGTRDYESIRDPHDLWKTLWVTRARQAPGRDLARPELACLIFEQPKYIENQTLA